jgi:translocation and assembly module TamA
VIGRNFRKPFVRCAALAAVLVLSAVPAPALDSLTFSFPGADRKLSMALRAASLLEQAETDNATDPQDLFAAARSDYSRLLGALYAQGYYGGVISITIDGREAADFAAVDSPSTINNIRVTVQPGRQFTFAKARMRPYAPGTKLPPAYGDTKIAQSTAISDAAKAGVDGWRQLGYAKASVVDQNIVADHSSSEIASEIILQAGPQLRFGKLNLTGYDRMHARRIVKIAGYREGDVFDPDTLDKMSDRLRRTGVFRSVIITEGKTPRPDGTLDIGLAVVEEPPRRIGFGAEASSADGANLSAFWLHRNLFGGGERLRFDAVLKGVDSKYDLTEYQIGVRLDRPATPLTDSSAYIATNLERTEILGLEIETFTFVIGAERVMSKTLTINAGLNYTTSSISDQTFKARFKGLSLPVSFKWDRRDDILDPRSGSYLVVGATPFWGFGTTDSGAQFKADARIYRSFSTDDRITLAGRLQLGTVASSQLLNTPPDFLFYSGGGGTVRGHPYQSLGIPVTRIAGSAVQLGGLSFIGLSGEVRAAINDKLGAAAFYDAGYIGATELWGGGGTWQTGAGLGVRYDTGFGPVRLDVAFPVSGNTGDGMQVYIGIGQAF